MVDISQYEMHFQYQKQVVSTDPPSLHLARFHALTTRPELRKSLWDHFPILAPSERIFTFLYPALKEGMALKGKWRISA